jgi:hypothetical protein
MRPQLPGVLLSFFLLSLPAQRALAGNPVVLERPAKAGESYRIQANGISKFHQLFTVGDEEQMSDSRDLSCSLVGTVEVLEVNEKSHASKIKVTVEKLTGKNGDEAPRTIVEPGGTVIVERVDDELQFAIPGGAVDEETENLLSSVLRLRDPRVNGAEKTFGSAEPREVGDEWEVNAQSAAEDLSRRSLRIDPGDVSGKVKLVEKLEVNGVPCIRVEGSFDVAKVGLQLPPGMQLNSSSMKASYAGVLPIEPDAPALETTTELKWSLEASGTDEAGKPMKLEIRQHNRTEIKRNEAVPRG